MSIKYVKSKNGNSQIPDIKFASLKDASAQNYTHLQTYQYYYRLGMLAHLNLRFELMLQNSNITTTARFKYQCCKI